MSESLIDIANSKLTSQQWRAVVIYCCIGRIFYGLSVNGAVNAFERINRKRKIDPRKAAKRENEWIRKMTHHDQNHGMDAMTNEKYTLGGETRALEKYLYEKVLTGPQWRSVLLYSCIPDRFFDASLNDLVEIFEIENIVGKRKPATQVELEWISLIGDAVSKSGEELTWPKKYFDPIKAGKAVH